MEPIRILICDDHDAFRQGLRAMLATDASLSVIGEAADGAAAVMQAAELQPDVILMDLQMPRLNGLEATRRIVAAGPHIRILVLTMSDDTATVFHALQAGARGYILKGARKADVPVVRKDGWIEFVTGPAYDTGWYLIETRAK